MYGNFCADYMPVNGDAIFQLGLMEYELVSLVIHQGTLDYGHYFAYHRSGSKSWFCMNDKKVSQVAFTYMKLVPWQWVLRSGAQRGEKLLPHSD